jgi:hypothetical protein
MTQGSSCLPPSRRASVFASLRRDRAVAGGVGGIAPLPASPKRFAAASRRDGGATLGFETESRWDSRMV